MEGLDAARSSLGFRVLRLHMGQPADPRLLERIEREVLGFPMPASLRGLYSEMDGVQLVQVGTFDDAPEPPAPGPIVPDVAGPLGWAATSDEFSGVWPEVAAATAGLKSFYTAVINIPDATTVFFHDWKKSYGLDEGTFPFDLFHHYRAAYLQRANGTLHVGLATDVMAALHDYAPISVEAYLEQILHDSSVRTFSIHGHAETLQVHSNALF